MRYKRIRMEVDGVPGTLVYIPQDPEWGAWSFDRVMIGKYPYYQLRKNGTRIGGRISGLANARRELEREGNREP